MSDIVQSVERALSIIEEISKYERGLRITDISNKLDLHISTTHRLLNTLIHMGYVQQDEETNKYELTLKLFEIGNRKLTNMDILDVAKPYAEELMKDINEVVHIVVRDGNEIVYIDKVEANNVISMSSNIGKRSPMYCTSVGKAILAELSIHETNEILDRTDYIKYTEHTLANKQEVLNEIIEVQKKGYAVDNEENEIGVRCVGSVIFDRDGDAIGAISISGPAFRVKEENMDALGETVKTYANLISREMGYMK